MSFRYLRTALRARAPLLARPSSFMKPLVRPMILRSTAVIQQQQQLKTILRPFSNARTCLNNGEVDPDLAHLLQEELNFATEEKEETPAFIQEFLDTNLFQIDDKVGHDKVILRRQFGNEKISVIFSIADINNILDEDEDDTAAVDDLLSPADGTTTSEESKDSRSDIEEAATDPLKEDVQARANVSSENQHAHEAESFPVRATVVIEKDNKGSLVLNTIAQDGYLNIDSVRYFKHGEFTVDDIIKADIGEVHRQDRYQGPVFEELEDELQETFSRYLEERGIDTALATFLPDYIDYKEQKEYVNWLNVVNDFVST